MSNKKKSSNKLDGQILSSEFSWILKEGLLIGLVSISFYLLIALISYNQQDPSFHGPTNTPDDVKNIAGIFGAWISDVALSSIGYTAYFIPYLFLHQAWNIFRDKLTKITLDGPYLFLKLTGLLLTILGATSLLSLANFSHTVNLNYGAGGLLGQSLMTSLSSTIYPVGTFISMLAISLIGLTLLADISWLKFLSLVGSTTLGLVNFFIKNLTNLYIKLKTLFDEYKIKRKDIFINNKKQPIKDKILKNTAHGNDSEKPNSIVNDLSKKIKTSKSKTPPKNLNKRVEKTDASYEVPDFTLLDEPSLGRQIGFTSDELEGLSNLLESKLDDFGIKAEVKSILPGPVITRFEIQPAPGVKVSRISNLVKDLARSLAVISVRVVEVIPGKSVVGIEIPNEDRAMVLLSEVLTSSSYKSSKSNLTLALGHDISGEPIVADLARMPHLLVAGTTGSGKSVGVNAMLLSLLYKSTPDDVRLILIDPKMLELSVYEGIPHLLTPVVTDMKDAANALRWCVGEMERRYKLMAALGVRNLDGFNNKISDSIKRGEKIIDPIWQPDPLSMVDIDDQEPPYLTELPSIVVVIDEFADMIMIVGKKVEQLIARIAQKARAAGIHLILATQRPSVDVITGLIKANVPTRIAFQVSSKVDSRTILDQGGAEQLLGHGDMLYLPPGSGVPIRVHGAFVSDDEVHRVADDWRSRAEADYIPDLIEDGSTVKEIIPGYESTESNDSEKDNLYDEAVAFVTETRKASISSVQRKLRIGYNRAARMIETMEEAGVISEMQPNGSREVIAPPPPKN